MCFSAVVLMLILVVKFLLSSSLCCGELIPVGDVGVVLVTDLVDVVVGAGAGGASW